MSREKLTYINFSLRDIIKVEGISSDEITYLNEIRDVLAMQCVDLITH